MQREPLQLRTVLKEAAPHTHAILGTYEFDGSFFEDRVLPEIQRLDATNIIVLTDTAEYHTSDDVRKAGKQYYLDHVRCPGVFHPKFLLLLEENRGLALIGSANLTENGWRSNGELVTTLIYDADAPDPAVAGAFGEIRTLLLGMCDGGLLPSRKHRERLEAAFDDAAWAAPADSPDDGLYVVHNLDDPILDQVLDQVGDLTGASAEILSPFFDAQANVVEALAGAGCGDITVYLQPKKVRLFRHESLSVSSLDKTAVTVRSVSFKRKPGRYIHAKLLRLITDDGTWLLYGSPNATAPGMLQTARQANVELAVVRHEPRGDYFDYVLHPDVFDIQPIKADTVPYLPGRPSPGQPGASVSLTDAYVTPDDHLTVHHDGPSTLEATVHLMRAGADKGLDLLVRDPADGEVHTALDGDAADFCRQPTLLSLTLATSEGELMSDKRWVSLPALEMVPRRRDLNVITESRGRFGLIELLEEWEDTDVLIYLLEAIDFDKMMPRLERARRRIMSQVQENQEGGPGLEERKKTEISQELPRIIKKGSRRLEKAMTPPSEASDWEERFHDVFNLYMTLSKLAVWLALRGKEAEAELRYLRVNTKKLMDFVVSMRTSLGADASEVLERDHGLAAHIAVLSHIADRLLIRAGWRQGSFANVYDVFHRSAAEAIRVANENRPAPVPSMNEIISVVDEYRVFKGLDVGPQQVHMFCQRILEQG